MTINPRDYDLDELREMARKPGDTQSGLDNGDKEMPDLADMEMDDVDEEMLSDSSMRSDIYRELLPFLSGDSHEKPYLDGIPQTYAAEFVIFEWLEFLLMHTGYKGTDEVLAYYESIGWITEATQSALSDYLLGIDESTANDGDTLSVDDHMLSLVYIAKLTAMT
jgi:flagellar protein FlaE